jgi:hypothetical protein
VQRCTTEVRTWNYYVNSDGEEILGRGRKFKAHVVNAESFRGEERHLRLKGGCFSSEGVRAYFRERGFSGHVGAFMQWLRDYGDQLGNGCFCATIPDDKDCLHYSGDVLAPSFCFGSEVPTLDTRVLEPGDTWPSHTYFVGFSMIGD